MMAIFHLMWKAIDDRMFLETELMKKMFLESFFEFFKRAKGEVVVYSFCVMSNHFHLAGQLLKTSKYLSAWAQAALSSIGQKINRFFKRKGPTAQDRFKTILVEDQIHLRRLMFYHDWNPVRAGMCGHPSEYAFSSFRFYAFGEVNAWTKHLTPPNWYLELAETSQARQAEYRRLCDEYGKENGLLEADADQGFALGSPKFVNVRSTLLKGVARQQRRGVIPRRDLLRIASISLALDTVFVPAAVFQAAGDAPMAGGTCAEVTSETPSPSRQEGAGRKAA